MGILACQPFNYDDTPLGPLGITVIIHNKPCQRKYWDYRGRNGFSASVAFNYYCCQQSIDAETKAVSITDTIEFFHHHLNQPSITPQDRFIHVLETLTAEMHHTLDIHIAQHLQEIDHLYHLFQYWQETKTTASPQPRTILKVTWPDVTRPPQDTTVKKPPRPQCNQKSPRVTPTSQLPET